MRITAQVGTDDVTGGFTRSNPLGTAAEQKEFNTGDQISVNGVTYEKGETSWNPVGDAYLKWQTNEMSVTAYYPAGKNNASATTFTVPTAYTDESPIADADYMTYSGTQSKGDDKAINLTMERKMVRIVVNEISFNDQFAEDYSVTAIKVHANTTGYADGEPVAGNIEVSALQQDGDFYALLAPTTENEDATFLTVTVAHDTNSEDVHTLTVVGIPATTAGNSYNYSLVVGKDYIGIGNVTVADWKTGEIIGGVAEEVIPNTFDATTMTPEQLNAAVTKALDYGHTEISVTLAEDADATMFTAITAALAATVDPSLSWSDIFNHWDVIQNKIDLTISGAETIPDMVFYFNDYDSENWKAAAVLRSVTLTDATTIGESAFFTCGNMTSFSAPKATTIAMGAFEACYSLTEVNLPSAQTIGAMAFSECTVLKEISLPECTSIGSNAFGSCMALETVYAPKATNFGSTVFWSDSLTKVTLGAVTSAEVSSDLGIFDEIDTKNIDLVLSPDQKVMIYDSGTKCWAAGTEAFDFNTTSFIGYTFKSITKQTQE